MKFDSDDSRPPYLRVAHSLRAAILTQEYKPGDKLPSGNELAEEYGVARMTVQNALQTLREEGLVVSRQGSGVFVRERTEKPVGLRPHLERAFEKPHVVIDFAGFSGETLHGAIQEPIDKIRVGRLVPQAIHIRILLPDTNQPMTLPCSAEDLSDDPAFRARAAKITEAHTGAIAESVKKLATLGLVKEAQVQIRVYRSAPLFKLYILNNEEAFFGFYPVLQRDITIEGIEHPMYDLVGKDAVLFQNTADGDDSVATEYVKQAKMWFDSVWNNVSYNPT
ncbi:MAG TPA: GntR family transcriptional regulator [Mycobacteriales bacterium]|jgi:DNA-binding transcriptional regulator YhcF (GntR family)|nr:GntR family transcriptional regulator [Mycobacteriales bacterium]